MTRRGTWRILALVAALSLVAAACGSDDGAGETTAAPTDGGDTTTTTAADDGGETTTTAAPDDGGETTTTAAADGGENFDIDLSGVSIRMTSPEASPLQMGQYLVLDKFGEWGAETELITIVNITGVQALVSDQADIAPHGADELILASAEGASVSAVGAPEARLNYVIVAKNEFPDVASLEGATIGMSGPAGFDALTARIALQEAGLDPQTAANFVQIGGSPDRAAALLAGQIDAATIFADDWINLDLQTDDLHVVARATDYVPNIPGSVFTGRSEYWSENPDVAFATACANLEVNKWIQDNRDQFIEYTMENVEGIEQEAVEAVYDFAMEVDMFPTNPEDVLSAEGMTALMEAMLETGDISQEIDVEPLMDLSYLEEAAGRGCGQ